MISGKPLLFLGHVVLMAAAFQAFLLLGTVSGKTRTFAMQVPASLILPQDRRSYELRLTEPDVAWAFGIQLPSAAPLHACNVQHFGHMA